MKGDKQGWNEQKTKEWHEAPKAGPLEDRLLRILHYFLRDKERF